MTEFRDKLAADLGMDLIVYVNQDGVDKGCWTILPRQRGAYRLDENPGSEAGLGQIRLRCDF